MPWVGRTELQTASEFLTMTSIEFSQNSSQFKGKDDSRQDAVMEQVFELVNNVLRQDKDTRKRSLQIRDYKIVPLASQAGVLEFVGHTTTLTSWLNIAHHRLCPFHALL